VYAIALLLGILFVSVQAWEWSDVTGGSIDFSAAASLLTYEEVTEMRVRDIKRRLARNHGFSADELSRMLDKKELIQALAFEEEKLRLTAEADMKRALFKQSVLVAVIAIFIAMCWPLLQHAYEVAHVNLVVYTDRKKLEAVRCWELRTYTGMFLVLVMLAIDVLQIWLSGSILLSWVTRSKYLFPVPSIPIRPAQLMGGDISRTSLASYGINVGPMAISWILRYANNQVERWTGRAMSQAQKSQRKAERANETSQERATRRAARKEAKRAAQERATGTPASNSNRGEPSGDIPEWMAPPHGSGRHAEPQPQPPPSREHEAFLQESMDSMNIPASGFDELD
jgi:hypothetical protein